MAFLAAFSPKGNKLSHFCTLKYFKLGNLQSLLVPLLGEIIICDQRVFCMKFNFRLLFEAFFDIIVIFNSIQPSISADFKVSFHYQDGGLAYPSYLVALLTHQRHSYHHILSSSSFLF